MIEKLFFHYKLLEARETVLQQYYCEQLAHFKWCTGEGRIKGGGAFSEQRHQLMILLNSCSPQTNLEFWLKFLPHAAYLPKLLLSECHLLHSLQHSLCISNGSNKCKILGNFTKNHWIKAKIALNAIYLKNGVVIESRNFIKF